MPTANPTRTRRKTVPRYELTQFTWVRTHKMLVAEASDLPAKTTPTAFDIHSPKTGKVYRFVYVASNLDREGEATSWTYVPDDSECPVVLVTVLND